VPDPEPRPPTIQGYVLHTRLGRGAYGEVWLGENRTTKRQVAVKFLHSRATLDWWLLDGETEKLAFLAADRRVVQLLDVGRDADPPFYVMEYVSRGSLTRYLESVGPLPLDRAVATFEEIALGLMQVHAKGILHCDLKPSNILLDDELRPRLADFGQSRLIDDRSPALALGTIFFMAPEQADPAAVPDARWDVYALGAVLYSMLEGRPPHHSEQAVADIRAEPDLPRRLTRYRRIVTAAAGTALPSSRKHRDKRLTAILAHCLAADPRKRFSTVKEVIEALRLRREARGRRPMMLLGGLGPALLLAVMAVFGLRGYRQATEQSADAIRQRAFESNRFAAAFIVRSLEGEIRRYFEVVTEEAAMPGFQTAFRAVTALSGLPRLAAAGAAPPATLVEEFRAEPSRMALDAHFRARLEDHLAEGRRDPKAPRFVSMFALAADGTHLAAAYSEPVRTRAVGGYYAWRSYFHGGPEDLPRTTPRERIIPIERPHLSAPFRSTTTSGWRVGVSVPLHEARDDGEQVFAGLLVLSVDIGNFEFLSVEGQPAQDRFAVLVDARRRNGDGPGEGRIMLHPYFADAAPPDPNDALRALAPPRIERDMLVRMTRDWRLAYRDPLSRAPGGAAFEGTWIAAAQSLRLPGPQVTDGDESGPDGLVVLVQERSGAAIGPVVQLGSRLMEEGLAALVAITLTVAALWFVVLRGRSLPSDPQNPAPVGPRPLRDRSTLSETGPEHG
jgi:hypothetical protein